MSEMAFLFRRNFKEPLILEKRDLESTEAEVATSIHCLGKNQGSPLGGEEKAWCWFGAKGRVLEGPSIMTEVRGQETEVSLSRFKPFPSLC